MFFKPHNPALCSICRHVCDLISLTGKEALVVTPSEMRHFNLDGAC